MLERGDRGVGLRALDRAQEARRDARALRRVGEAEALALAHPAELRTERPVGGLRRARAALCARGLDVGCRRSSRLMPGMFSRCTSRRYLMRFSSFEQLGAVEPIATAGADRRDQALALPEPERRRADADDPRGLADGEESVAGSRATRVDRVPGRADSSRSPCAPRSLTTFQRRCNMRLAGALSLRHRSRRARRRGVGAGDGGVHLRADSRADRQPAGRRL